MRLVDGELNPRPARALARFEREPQRSSTGVCCAACADQASARGRRALRRHLRRLGGGGGGLREESGDTLTPGDFAFFRVAGGLGALPPGNAGGGMEESLTNSRVGRFDRDTSGSGRSLWRVAWTGISGATVRACADSALRSARAVGGLS